MGRSAGIRRPRWRAYPGGGPQGPSPPLPVPLWHPSPPPGWNWLRGWRGRSRHPFFLLGRAVSVWRQLIAAGPMRDNIDGVTDRLADWPPEMQRATMRLLIIEDD